MSDKKYTQHGEDNPVIQILIASLSNTVRHTLQNISASFDYDVAAAVLMTAAGTALGELQAMHVKHSEECDKCPPPPDFCELAVKNFNAGFDYGKSAVEQEHAKGAAQADDLLARVLKEHKP